MIRAKKLRADDFRWWKIFLSPFQIVGLVSSLLFWWVYWLINQKRTIRKKKEQGRFMLWEEVESNLESGKGTLIAERDWQFRCYSFFWIDEEEKNLISEPEASSPVGRLEMPNHHNIAIWQKTIDDESGTAFMTSPPRRAREKLQVDVLKGNIIDPKHLGIPIMATARFNGAFLSPERPSLDICSAGAVAIDSFLQEQGFSRISTNEDAAVGFNSFMRKIDEENAVVTEWDLRSFYLPLFLVSAVPLSVIEECLNTRQKIYYSENRTIDGCRFADLCLEGGELDSPDAARECVAVFADHWDELEQWLEGGEGGDYWTINSPK